MVSILDIGKDITGSGTSTRYKKLNIFNVGERVPQADKTHKRQQTTKIYRLQQHICSETCVMHVCGYVNGDS